MTKDQSEGVKLLVPPPLFAIVPLIVGLVIHFIFPWGFLPAGGIQFAIGLPLSIIGASLMVTAGMTLVRAKTDSTFSRPTTAIVTHGLYGRSRNPIFLSVIVLYIGIAAAFNALWPVLFLPLVVILILFGAILPEERYLEKNFGEEWLKYKSRVRRWL